MMNWQLIQVDAFTNRPFSGNPAAVCILPEMRSSAWLQHMAREMNLSETAFLLPHGDGFSLRWFTPKVEVDLCGHATLASAHVLWTEGYLASTATARFVTRSGLLTAQRHGDWIELNFPPIPCQTVSVPDGLESALGVKPRWVGLSSFAYLVELDSETMVQQLQPNFSLLAPLHPQGVIVTSIASTPGFDFVSRFFAPSLGVDEDPVTGAAHCCLTPFWAGRLGTSELVAHQASARGGIVRVREGGGRIYVSGQAVTVFKAIFDKTLYEFSDTNLETGLTETVGF